MRRTNLLPEQRICAQECVGNEKTVRLGVQFVRGPPNFPDLIPSDSSISKVISLHLESGEN